MLNNVILSLIFILLSFNSFGAKTASECLNSLESIVKGDEVKEEKLREFLKLQAGLTMHKLALATFAKDINKERFTLEGQILNILDEMDENRKNAEFDKVYKMFKHPKNKLSRHALAEVLPLIKDILNKQSEEEDPVKRQLFNLDMSDIKMLSILTEKEKQYNNGSYAQILSSNKASDNSVLNFTKIINSSIRNTNASNNSIRKTMERRLKNLVTQANKLVLDLLSGTECEVLLQACSQKAQDGTLVMSNNLLNAISGIADKLSNPDKHKYLRYGDVWLYTKWRKEKKITPPKYKYYQTQHKTDDEIIHEHLVQRVLDYFPYYFKREDLFNDPELTLSLARAIDRGVITEEDQSKRVFVYKGKEYFIPDQMNGSYSGNRFEKMAKDSWHTGVMNLVHGWGDDLTDIKYPNEIEEEDHEAFLETRNEQKFIHGKKSAFVFKGKLYQLDGTYIPNTLDGLFAFPSGKKNLPIEKLEIDDAQKKLVAMEIADNNSSYIKDGTVFYVSGVKVDFNKAYKRIQARYDRGNYTVSGGKKGEEFPTKEKLSLFMNEDVEMHKVILKGLADEKKAVVHENKMVDIVDQKVYSVEDAKGVIILERAKQGIERTPEQLNFDEDYLKSNAVSIINKQLTFRVGDNTYHSASGFKLGQKNKDNSLISGMISHEEKHNEINHLNSLDQKSLIVEYHKKFKDNKCEYYTILDKKAAKLTVFSQDGRIINEQDALIGQEVGDERTLYRNYANKETNNKTGAGFYYLGSPKKANLSDHYNQFDGNYLTLLNSDGETVVSGLHQVANSTPERNTLLNNNDPGDNRATTGGISISKNAMENYMSSYYEQGCPFYVLPEENKVGFKVVGDQLVFENKTGNSADYHFKNTVAEQARDIKILITDERYKNRTTERFLNKLQDSKEDIMKHLELTNDEYNELVKIAFGVLGVESEFSENFWYDMKETKLGQILITDMKKYGAVGGAVKAGATTGLLRLMIFKDPKENSRGPTQVKDVNFFVPDEFDISNVDLDNPENAAVATMFVLANKYKHFKKCEGQHAGISDKNRMDYLYYYYMGSNDQICEGAATVTMNPKADRVRQYKKGVAIYEEP